MNQIFSQNVFRTRCPCNVSPGRRCTAASVTAHRAASPVGRSLENWLAASGAPEQLLELCDNAIDGRHIDVSVAKRDIAAGEAVLRLPEHLVVTLDQVFENETVAEVLTTDKLSELACLALYLMYEKKRGKESTWYAYIKELDKQRARGQFAAESPLLWTEEEVASYLQGSPVQTAVRQRLASIREEYQELDTVWFMSGSLFNKYPYDVPTEAFPFEVFKQAFAAVQASIVHLQGVPLAKRFALVPLGPPSLSYSSNAKAMISYNAEAREVQLIADRDYAAGERVFAWCGPQPNSRLLINYGIVNEHNPHDKLPITATIPNSDPLYQVKRRLLETAKLSTQQLFQLQHSKELPQQLLPFMRMCYCTDEAQVRQIDLTQTGDVTEADAPILQHLVAYLQQRLSRYARSREEDEALLADESTPVRQKVACRLLVQEKILLEETMAAIQALPHAPQGVDVTIPSNCVRLH